MATTWYYFDSNGEKQGPISGGRLKGLAKAGLITPETVVETETGKTALAKKVKGLTFIEPAVEAVSLLSERKKVVPTSTGESYDVKLPPPEPSPFTASIPETVDTSVAAPSEMANPFTASMSVVAKPTDNPFTVTMPTSEKG